MKSTLNFNKLLHIEIISHKAVSNRKGVTTHPNLHPILKMKNKEKGSSRYSWNMWSLSYFLMLDPIWFLYARVNFVLSVIQGLLVSIAMLRSLCIFRGYLYNIDHISLLWIIQRVFILDSGHDMKNVVFC